MDGIDADVQERIEKSKQTIEQILFVIKKTRLILNEYKRIFESYLQEMAEKDASVSEQIISSTTFAVNCIKGYIEVLNNFE